MGFRPIWDRVNDVVKEAPSPPPPKPKPLVMPPASLCEPVPKLAPLPTFNELVPLDVTGPQRAFEDAQDMRDALAVLKALFGDKYGIYG